jgi:hypothetical protein
MFDDYDAAKEIPPYTPEGGFIAAAILFAVWFVLWIIGKIKTDALQEAKKLDDPELNARVDEEIDRVRTFYDGRAALFVGAAIVVTTIIRFVYEYFNDYRVEFYVKDWFKSLF